MRQRSAGWKIAALGMLAALLCLGALAQAETVRKGGVQVQFDGKLTPKSLPRSGQAPISVSVSAKVTPIGAEAPPPMRQIAIAINRYGQLDGSGLPVCHFDQIQPATTDDALAACRGSLVGQGRFLADVSGRAPFPADGKIYAFSGELEGRPAILAHVYGTKPLPASYTLAFVISKSKGTFGTTLKATLPPVKSGTGSITAIYLTLGKSFSVGGKRRSYLSASCPAPEGISDPVSFPFARASVGFQGGPTVDSTLIRRCKPKG